MQQHPQLITAYQHRYDDNYEEGKDMWQELSKITLIKIFQNVSLIDLLLKIPLVCKQWKIAQEEVCQKKWFLQLSNREDDEQRMGGLGMAFFYQIDPSYDIPFRCPLYDDDYFCYYYHDDYSVDQSVKNVPFSSGVSNHFTSIFSSYSSYICLDDQRCAQFCDKFPNITHLAITSENKLYTKIVASLVSHWSLKLTTLKLYGHFDWCMLKNAINHLAALNSLSISVDIYKVSQLIILDQLEELNCRFIRTPIGHNIHHDEGKKINLKMIMKKLFGGNKLKQFGLEQFYGFNDIPLDDHWWPEGTLTKLTRLKVSINCEHYLEQLCTKCPSLSYLQLTCVLPDCHYGHYFELLSRLRQMTSLTLHFMRVEKWNQHFTSEHILKLPPLKSVKSAYVRSMIDPHYWPLIQRQLLPNTDVAYFRLTRSLYLCEYIPSTCGDCNDCEICRLLNNLIAKFRYRERRPKLEFYVNTNDTICKIFNVHDLNIF